MSDMVEFLLKFIACIIVAIVLGALLYNLGEIDDDDSEE
jgi:hypothetical protein